MPKCGSNFLSVQEKVIAMYNYETEEGSIESNGLDEQPSKNSVWLAFAKSAGIVGIRKKKSSVKESIENERVFIYNDRRYNGIS